MNKAISILSGGLDSSVATVLAGERFDVVTALTFDYGQRAAEKEIAAARYFCKKRGIKSKIISLNFLSKTCAFTSLTGTIPLIQARDLSSKGRMLRAARLVWVPNRNSIFINIAAGIAEAEKINLLVVGFNKEEALTFPDNSKEFLRRTNAVLKKSTRNGMRVISPTIEMDKTEILGLALKKGLDIERLWYCYNGLDRPCKKCESCARFMRAAKKLAVL